jgi:hypothetical protein
MASRSLSASLLVPCLLGFLGMAPMAPAAHAETASLKGGKIAGKNALAAKRRYRLVRIHLPVGPASIYYDYPYYYARGYYPTHIGGYVYYTNNRVYYPRYIGPKPLRRYRPASN